MERIRQIEERLSKITPWPWSTGNGYEQSNRGNYVSSKANGHIVCAEQDQTDCVLDDGDAEFIAHTPEDIAYLLDELKRMQKFMKVRTTNGESAEWEVYLKNRDIIKL